MNIRHMYLHNRHINRCKCISYRIAVMCVCTGIDNNSVLVSVAFLNFVDYCAFVVRLEYLNIKTKLFCFFLYFGIDTVIVKCSVYTCFPYSRKIYIRPVYKADFFHNILSPSTTLIILSTASFAFKPETSNVISFLLS